MGNASTGNMTVLLLALLKPEFAFLFPNATRRDLLILAPSTQKECFLQSVPVSPNA